MMDERITQTFKNNLKTAQGHITDGTKKHKVYEMLDNWILAHNDMILEAGQDFKIAKLYTTFKNKNFLA